MKLEEKWKEGEKTHSEICAGVQRLLCSKISGWMDDDGFWDEVTGAKKIEVFEEMVLYLKPCFGPSLMALLVPLLNLEFFDFIFVKFGFWLNFERFFINANYIISFKLVRIRNSFAKFYSFWLF